MIGQVEVKEVDSGETNVLLVMTKWKGKDRGCLRKERPLVY